MILDLSRSSLASKKGCELSFGGAESINIGYPDCDDVSAAISDGKQKPSSANHSEYSDSDNLCYTSKSPFVSIRRRGVDSFRDFDISPEALPQMQVFADSDDDTPIVKDPAVSSIITPNSKSNAIQFHVTTPHSTRGFEVDLDSDSDNTVSSSSSSTASDTNESPGSHRDDSITLSSHEQLDFKKNQLAKQLPFEVDDNDDCDSAIITNIADRVINDDSDEEVTFVLRKEGVPKKKYRIIDDEDDENVHQTLSKEVFSKLPPKASGSDTRDECQSDDHISLVDSEDCSEGSESDSNDSFIVDDSEDDSSNDTVGSEETFVSDKENLKHEYPCSRKDNSNRNSLLVGDRDLFKSSATRKKSKKLTSDMKTISFEVGKISRVPFLLNDNQDQPSSKNETSLLQFEERIVRNIESRSERPNNLILSDAKKRYDMHINEARYAESNSDWEHALRQYLLAHEICDGEILLHAKMAYLSRLLGFV